VFPMDAAFYRIFCAGEIYAMARPRASAPMTERRPNLASRIGATPQWCLLLIRPSDRRRANRIG
jgi:hypothetical protein